ncbi:hypothetical protein PFDG_05058 [Plasmodium falciparum Dd2]|uniref:Uncharacterized protein n=1 Tax=Plasmodium falciparum (isolate Dd2) TaxID=57267 RepID=A0A0L7M9G6_PLAF4|nr:hypothetical protein PFDG_05058 [Plasmodium falciparum Dd2]
MIQILPYPKGQKFTRRRTNKGFQEYPILKEIIYQSMKNINKERMIQTKSIKLEISFL